MKKKFYMIILAIILLIPSVLGNQDDLTINELLAINDNILISETDSPDWFEIYNIGEETVDLSGMFLSDKEGHPTKYQIPNGTIIESKGFLLFIADDEPSLGPLHTNFKLDGDGEFISLYANDGETLIDSIIFSEQKADTSIGRNPDGSEMWAAFSNPTPSSSNGIALSTPPTFNHEAGSYEDEVTLTITVPEPNTKIYFTTDGETPNQTVNHLYTEPISIAKTTPLRAISVTEGKLPSPTITKTYLINEVSTLPIISVVGTYNDIFVGLFKQNVIQTYGNKIAKPLHIEYFDSTGNFQFGLDAEAKPHGEFTTFMQGHQKALRVYAKKTFGTDKIEYALFPHKDIDSFKRIILRTSGQDGIAYPTSQHKTHFRDAFVHIIAKDLNIDYQAYQPAILFINGEYWGIYNIRERMDEYYLAENFNIDKDSVTILELAHNIYKADGTDGFMQFEDVFQFMLSNDMSETENYEYITNHIDIDNFIDYSILEIFVGNHDWPYNNIKIWHQKPSSKWRFLLFDTDFAFGGGVQEAQYKNPHFNSFNYSLHYYNTYLVNEKPIVWREMMKRLLINEKFRKQFLNRFADLMNSNLEPAKIMGTMNQLSQTLEPEINRHIERWEKSTIPWYTLSDWNSAINQMKEYIEGSGESKPRRDYVFEHLTNYFDDIDGTSTITIEPPCGGTVSINTVTPSSPPWSGTYFNNIPITLSATANNGFEFVQWSDGSTEAVYEKTLTNSENMKALFKRKESNRVKNHDASQSLNYWVASSELVKTDDEVGDKMFFLATGTTLAQQIDVTCEQELISKGALMISTHAEAKAASNAMASLTVEFMNQNNETIAITDSSSSPAWEGIQMKKIPVPSATTSIKLILSADVESNRRINGHVLFDNVSLIHYNRFDAIAKNQKDITKPKLYSSNERVREPPHRRIYKS